MSTDQSDPGSWIGRLFGWSLLLLGAALAIQAAVDVLEAVLVPLSLLILVTLVIWSVVAWRRRF